MVLCVYIFDYLGTSFYHILLSHLLTIKSTNIQHYLASVYLLATYHLSIQYYCPLNFSQPVIFVICFEFLSTFSHAVSLCFILWTAHLLAETPITFTFFSLEFLNMSSLILAFPGSHKDDVHSPPGSGSTDPFCFPLALPSLGGMCACSQALPLPSYRLYQGHS